MANYLIDTNALFIIIKALSEEQKCAQISEIIQGKCYISELTKIEIISVLGKYSRGCSGQKQKCDKIISEDGEVCSNFCYMPKRKPWKKRVTASWIKLIQDIIEGNSTVLSTGVIPLSDSITSEAEKFIVNALKHDFKSMDAMIAATAIDFKKRNNDEITLVTNDKRLIYGLNSADCLVTYIKLV